MGLFDSFKKKNSPLIHQKEMKAPIKNERHNISSKIIIETAEDMLIYYNLSYDFNKIPVINEKENGIKRYLLKEKNLIQAKKDILSLNKFLCEAKDKIDLFPNVQINETSINFMPSHYQERIDFCWIKCTPLTPTGKESKYPMELHFQGANGSNKKEYIDDIFGEISVLKDGSIGKARIIVWNNDKLFIVHCIKKKDVIYISKIEKTNNQGVRDVLYKK